MVLASAGVQDFLIVQLGRWRSLCFRIYCRRDKRLHAWVAAVIASTQYRYSGQGYMPENMYPCSQRVTPPLEREAGHRAIGGA